MDFYQIFPVRSFAKKSNQMLSNMLSKIRIHFLKMKIQSTLSKIASHISIHFNTLF